ncbi:MAG: phage tail sheath subtilisin-like domain-containing protein [Planctomycetota bacterium]
MGQFGALYFPWLGASTASQGVLWMPPSGHLAGLFARVDLSSGIQKSPANEVLSEVQGVMYDVTEETRGQLNVESVNVLKATGPRGVRVMGARTLIDPRNSELSQWRYVSVRRLLMMLEKSLERAGFWLVHTDNRPERWRDVERVIRDFLRREWQSGRLGGTTPEEAFSVTCDESTNPPEDVERGRMTCVIGVQPPLPAEFVFVRLGNRGGSGGTWSFGESRNGAT